MLLLTALEHVLILNVLYTVAFFYFLYSRRICDDIILYTIGIPFVSELFSVLHGRSLSNYLSVLVPFTLYEFKVLYIG